MTGKSATMRDTFIDALYERMGREEKLFFLSADFGAPKLDSFRVDYPERFINVGIAEQNLINVAAGLALEGFTVFAYGIAPFLTMRAYEQIRNNLALLAHLRVLNVNLIGVGAGLSYEVSGPTHHCLEDLSIMRTLPNVALLSPSDPVLTARLLEYTIRTPWPKYLRLDGKPLPPLYGEKEVIAIEDGFHELATGHEVCLVATGYMTHKALRVRELLRQDGIEPGVLDLFMLKPCNEEGLARYLSRYRQVVTMEEGFRHRGGLDSLVAGALSDFGPHLPVTSLGFNDQYVYEIGDREYLFALHGLDDETVAQRVRQTLRSRP